MKESYKRSGNVLMFLVVIFALLSVNSVSAGGKNISLFLKEAASNPQVAGINIAEGASEVDLQLTISSSNVYLPNAGIDAETLTNNSVKLYQVDGDQLIDVPSEISTSGGFDVINLTPNEDLLPNTTYRFVVTEALKDQDGIAFLPFSSSFTTNAGGAAYNGPIAFVDPTTVASGGNGYTSLLIGPDGKFYALTSNGYLKRWQIDHSTGLLTEEQGFNSIQNAEGGDRLAIGMCFDPASTADNLILWVSHTSYGFAAQPDFQGKVTRLSGSDFSTVQDYVVHLPRSKKDHATNALSFGPDGALYISQGANTAMGTYDNAWQRDDVLLSAALLRLDVAKIATEGTVLPIDAKTEDGGTYNPYAPDAPLTLYATGIRNAYDMVWHSNGQLYMPTNGSAGYANAPGSSPTSKNYREPQYQSYNGPEIPYATLIPSQNDFVFRITQGGYYGHPNPKRAQYVLNGGNPVNPAWPEAVVEQYPEGTEPDANYKGYSASLGANKSANGVIEYKSDAFSGALRGKLINVWFTTGDVVVMEPSAEGEHDIATVTKGIPGFSGYNRPLDVIEDTVNGNLYISEYQSQTRGGEGKITLIKPSIPASQRALSRVINVNFQDEATATPEGWLKDFGEPYGEKPALDTTLTYGWLKKDKATPLNLTEPGNGRARSLPENNSLLSTFMHMQGADINDGGNGVGEEGTWGIALPNGVYKVVVSVGDSINLGNINYQINAEGVSVINHFDPRATPYKFYTDSATVTVADGVLNIDAFGGKNTKINALTIEPGDPARVAPDLEVRLNYAPNTGSYINRVAVSAQAYVKSPVADQVTLTYTLVQNADTIALQQPYTEVIALDQPGAYTLTLTATDNTTYQNTTSVTNAFSILTAAGGQIALENMTKIPGTKIGFPADDWYSFHKSQDPRNSRGKITKFYDTNVMRISNTGIGPLTISRFEISDSTRFQVVAINGQPFDTSQLPLVIDVGAYADATIRFVESNGAKGVRKETLVIHSNAGNAPAQTALLNGTYMRKTESSNEVNAIELMRVMGIATSMNNRPKPGSKPPSEREVNIGYHGDLILSPVFEQADSTQPVRAFQLASFKGPGSQVARLVEQDSEATVADFEFQIDSTWHQSIFPMAEGDSIFSIAGDSAALIDRPFRMLLDGYLSSGGNDLGQKVGEVTGVRVYKVYDRDGNLIPYHYIFLQDYVRNGCGAGTANCDWNDGLYYFMNIKPLQDPFIAGALADTLVNRNTSLSYNVSTAFNQGYAGNKLTYSASLNNGNLLPDWLTMDTTTGILSGRMPEDAVNAFDIKVMAIDLNGIQVFDQDSTVFSILTDSTAAIDSTLWLEAECASAGSYWNFVQDSMASAGYYATIKAGFTSTVAPPTDEAGILSFSLEVMRAADYHILGRTKAATEDDNAYWLKIDSSDWVLQEVMPSADDMFQWQRLQDNPVTLSQGNHLLQIAYADDGFAVDKIHLTAADTLPTDLGGAGCKGESILLSNRVVEKSSAVGTIIGDLIGLNITGPLTYELIEGQESSDNYLFDIKDGQLSVAAALDAGKESYNIYVEATDAQGTTYQQLFVIRATGETQQPPVLRQPISDQAIVVGEAYSFTIPDSTFTNVDEDTLTYTVSMSDGPLPAWLRFDPAMRTLSGTPVEVDTVQIIVAVSDQKGGTASDTFAISVHEQIANNHAPVAGTPIQAQAATAGEAFTLVIPENTFSDEDAGDVLSYTISMAEADTLPSWLKFDAQTRTISGTPPESDTLNITVTVSDLAGATASQAFTLTIANNVTGVDPALQPKVKIYPNPVTQQELYLQLDNIQAKDISYFLWTVEGKLVAQARLTLKRPQQPTLIRLDGINAGVYVLEVQGQSFVIRQSVLVR